jgi:hypothetical protein
MMIRFTGAKLPKTGKTKSGPLQSHLQTQIPSFLFCQMYLIRYLYPPKPNHVPTIDQFEGIKINIYSNDHVPPHVHALYGEHEALLEIRRKRVYAGFLPPKQRQRAMKWLSVNEEDALSIFYQLNPGLKK